MKHKTSSIKNFLSAVPLLLVVFATQASATCTDDTQLNQLTAGTQLKVVSSINLSACEENHDKRSMLFLGKKAGVCLDQKFQVWWESRRAGILTSDSVSVWFKPRNEAEQKGVFSAGACDLLKVYGHPDDTSVRDSFSIGFYGKDCPISSIEYNMYEGGPISTGSIKKPEPTIGRLKKYLGESFELVPVCK